MRKILIADSNTTFATVIGEALQNMGQYRVTLAASGPEARQRCGEIRPDLAVIDVDLPDCQPATLIAQMREAIPGLPVVLIPYSEEEVPQGLDIQGVLVKPFFLPDLPTLINTILGTSDAPEPSPQPPPLGWVKTGPLLEPVVIVLNEADRPLIGERIQALSHALRDEPVLLTQAGTLIAISPPLSQTDSEALAEAVAKAWKLHRPGTDILRFEGTSENSRYLLFSTNVAGEVSLSVAMRVRIPLSVVRKLMHETAAELAAMITQKA